MKRIFVAALMLFTAGSFAQEDKNLVTNPGFESLKGKLKKQKQISVATNWESPTGLAADLFSAQVKELVSAPRNYVGTEQPLEGDNYAGIVAYSYNGKSPRTYIQTELLGPLKKGTQYCVKFNVSLADLSKYSSNNLGAYITQKRFEVEGKSDIVFDDEKDLSKVVLHPKNETFDGRYNWETVCNVFTASGKEKFLIIGNFHNTKDTKFKKLKKPKDLIGIQTPLAYYYVDQVEVFILDSIEECQCAGLAKDEVTRVIYRKQLTVDGNMTVEQKVKNATVYFDFLKNNIDASMFGDLEKLVTLLKEDQSINLELQGYVGDEEHSEGETNEYYLQLDKRRVESVKKYLVEKGVSESRLTIVAKGDSNPVSTDGTELAKAKNRRVEFILK